VKSSFVVSSGLHFVLTVTLEDRLVDDVRITTDLTGRERVVEG